MGRHLAMSPRKSSLAVLAKALFRTFMGHLFLELFKPVVQYVLGPMAVAWLTSKLNKKPKA
jgi:hypothetical protein